MISATIDLLVLGGTEAVTTSAVAQKAAVPIGSVYQFFPDRETLLLAVAEVSSRPLRETAEMIKTNSIQRTDLDSWLTSVLNQLEEQWSKHPADVAAWNALVSVPNMDAVTQPIFTHFVNALTAGIIQHQKPLHLTENETNELCWILTTSLTAVLSSSLVTQRTHAMGSFKHWAACMFTRHVQ
jgi:AcrR family transcriptional regulator